MICAIHMRQRRRAGFSLVEISLALLVVSVGLMAVFGLFSSGLDTNKKSCDDTTLTLFADEVFNGYRAMCVSNWSAITLPIALSPAAPDMWVNAASLGVVPLPAPNSANPIPLAFTNNFLGQPVPDHALRYRLTRYTVVPGNTNYYGLLLEVWPNALGTANDPVQFYTELYNGGM